MWIVGRQTLIQQMRYEFIDVQGEPAKSSPPLSNIWSTSEKKIMILLACITVRWHKVQQVDSVHLL